MAAFFVACPAQTQNFPNSSGEVEPRNISPEFLKRWEYKRDPVRDLLLEGAQRKVRLVYLVPADKPTRTDYRSAIANAFFDLREFYRQQLGNGYSFVLASPTVEIYQTSHLASYYPTNPSGFNSPQYIWFWENTLVDGFSLTGGGFNDPNNRWIFYIDADVGCGQIIGGNAGVAVMAANDMRGLTGEQNVPSCVGQSPDNGGHGRWVGGAGHELAHTFNVPHPPGCGGPGPNSGCTGGAFAANSIMWVGYAFYPNTYFLPEDGQTLLNSGFFYNTLSISGRVIRPDGRGVAGGRVVLSSQGGPSVYAMTNSFGYYRFSSLAAGAAYTLQAESKSFDFDPLQITPLENLTGIDISAR